MTIEQAKELLAPSKEDYDESCRVWAMRSVRLIFELHGTPKPSKEEIVKMIRRGLDLMEKK